MTTYWECIERATYYRWSAQRSDTIAGNDPLTGLPSDRPYRAPLFRGEGRAAYIAMATYWFNLAKSIRENEKGR